MDILVVGNVLKDVYLNFDARKEGFETDKRGVEWLDLEFNGAEHTFFNRCAVNGGAAITLEVLEKLGISAKIAGDEAKESEKNSIDFRGSSLGLRTERGSEEGLEGKSEGESEEETKEGLETGILGRKGDRFRGEGDGFNGNYRYILVSEEGVCYFMPEKMEKTELLARNLRDFSKTLRNSGVAVEDFREGDVSVSENLGELKPKCIYIDCSANLDREAIFEIEDFLERNSEIKLVLYYQENRNLEPLINKAVLVFSEKALERDIPQVILSETKISYREISEAIKAQNFAKLTRLSAFSIMAGTVLGCFLLGKTVEESLRFARVNVEEGKLNSTLSLKELEMTEVEQKEDIELIAANLVYRGKGILAADESGGSIKKKFKALGILDTFQNRHDYRDIFFTTPGLNKYVNGVILFDETARDRAENGQTYVEFLTSRRIIPGIKVDQGLVPFEGGGQEGGLEGVKGDSEATINGSRTAGNGPRATNESERAEEPETITKGLEGLSRRLEEYYNLGLRFAKWRAAFKAEPSREVILENARILAEYALKCQMAGIVPIVEPEVVYDGDYDIKRCAEMTGEILEALFKALREKKVNLRACILKCNMVLAGKRYARQSTPEEVGRETAEVLRAHVPKELAGVVFLSGGQTPEQATENLRAVIKNGPFPWPVTFSFARALQDPALYAWQGDNTKRGEAKEAFLGRLEENARALERH